MADASPLAGVAVGGATGCVLLTGTALVEARFAGPALAGVALTGFALNEVSNGAGGAAVAGFIGLAAGSACTSAAGSGVIAARQPFELCSTLGFVVVTVSTAGAFVRDAPCCRSRTITGGSATVETVTSGAGLDRNPALGVGTAAGDCRGCGEKFSLSTVCVLEVSGGWAAGWAVIVGCAFAPGCAQLSLAGAA